MVKVMSGNDATAAAAAAAAAACMCGGVWVKTCWGPKWCFNPGGNLFFFVGVIVQHATTCKQALRIINQNQIKIWWCTGGIMTCVCVGLIVTWEWLKGLPCSQFFLIFSLAPLDLHLLKHVLPAWNFTLKGLQLCFTKPFQKVHEDSWFRS